MIHRLYRVVHKCGIDQVVRGVRRPKKVADPISTNPELKHAIYATHLSEEELQKAWKRVQSELDKKEYDYNAWFFGDEERRIKRWTGYSLGYWLVQKKMKESGKQASELVTIESKNLILDKQ